MVSRLPAGGFAGEGFGIVYLEANAYGVPVVAGAVGGATDAVIEGEPGCSSIPRTTLRWLSDVTPLVTREMAQTWAQRSRRRVEPPQVAGGCSRLENESQRLMA